MKIMNINEHLSCFNYDHSEKPQIEIVRFSKEETKELYANTNEIVFFLEGKVKYTFYKYPECAVENKNMIFLPMGYKCIYHAQSDAVIVIFRLYNPVKLCESFFIERLFSSKTPNPNIDDQTKTLKILEINPRMQHFITGITDCVTDGIKCKHYFDIKIKEFFLMLRAYYSKNELREFLTMILTRDIAFSEYVRTNRNKYPTVVALADSMHLTQKQFARRFKKVFGRTPYGWMKDGRILSIHYEVTATKKPLKQIAIEAGFSSTAQFSKFCRKELGKTPLELRNENF